MPHDDDAGMNAGNENHEDKNLDAENVDAEDLDAENLDAEKPVGKGENLDVENLDAEGSGAGRSDNLDVENLAEKSVGEGPASNLGVDNLDVKGLPLYARGAVAVGLALAALVGAGLVLNLAGGLTAASWAVAAGILVAVGVAGWLGVRYARRRGDGRTGKGEVAPVPYLRVRSFAFDLPTTGYLLLAVALAAGAVVLAARGVGWQRSAGFAELWLVPEKGTAALGVRNDYPATETFRLVLRRGAVPVGDWQLRLAAGQSWRSSIVAPAGSSLTATLTGTTRVLTVAVTP
jgi:hypothetical protein